MLGGRGLEKLGFRNEPSFGTDLLISFCGVSVLIMVPRPIQGREKILTTLQSSLCRKDCR